LHQSESSHLVLNLDYWLDDSSSWIGNPPNIVELLYYESANCQNSSRLS
jgi:hypothetical protein